MTHLFILPSWYQMIRDPERWGFELGYSFWATFASINYHIARMISPDDHLITSYHLQREIDIFMNEGMVLVFTCAFAIRTLYLRSIMQLTLLTVLFYVRLTLLESMIFSLLAGLGLALLGIFITTYSARALYLAFFFLALSGAFFLVGEGDLYDAIHSMWHACAYLAVYLLVLAVTLGSQPGKRPLCLV